MNERALAHIERVHDIQPIPNADKIELVHVLGWALVASKGEFKEGDLCVYIEIDSKVPDNLEVFAFLENRNYKVKTIKLRGQISQGLALSLDKFNGVLNPAKMKEGLDVTKQLHITKIMTDEEKRLAREAEDPRASRVKQRLKKFVSTKFGKWCMRHKLIRKLILFLFGGKKKKRKAWPDFVSKTDETRIENIPQQLMDKRPLEVTEKLDGTSTTYFLHKVRNKLEFGVCSRNIRQFDENQKCYHDHNIYWDNAFKYNIESALKCLWRDLGACAFLVLQGESVGSVQGNPYKLSEDRFYGFNLIVDGVKLDSVIAMKKVEPYGILWVPILQTDFVCPDTMEEMKELATGKSVINPQVLREGCVYRDKENTISFKNVSNVYLLKHAEKE